MLKQKIICSIFLVFFLVIMLYGVFSHNLCWFWTGMIGFHFNIQIKKRILKKKKK